MPDIALVCMPFTPVNRPAIGLGQLKAALGDSGLSSEVVYANLLLAEEIGLERYQAVLETPVQALVGEWLFSSAAFPELQNDPDDYLRWLMSAAAMKLAGALPSDGPDLSSTFREIRQAIPGFVDRVSAAILSMRPRIVGCASSLAQHCASLAVLRRLKEARPQIITMMGGANCEGEMGLATIKQFAWVDVAVSGEATHLIGELCRGLMNQGPALNPESLPPGVVTRNSPLDTPPITAIDPDLSQVPTPNYDDYFKTLDKLRIKDEIVSEIPIRNSRGCWWGKCNFCAFSGGVHGYTSRPAERATQEMDEQIRRYGINRFFVVDDIIEPSYFDTLIKTLAERGDSYDIFHQVRPALSREKTRSLAAAGIRRIQCGIETLDDDLLRTLNKGVSALRNMQFLKYSREARIYPFWILLWGAPLEQDEWYARMANLFPKLVHLPPPYVLRIQFMRFSSYHERPNDFRVKLRPAKAYSFIYPGTEEDLRDLVYHFEDDNRPSVAEELKNRPGLRSAVTNASQWRSLWTGWENEGTGGLELEGPPVLTASRNRDSMVIRDTRPCALDYEYNLTGLSAAVFDACDRIVTPDGLLKLLQGEFDYQGGWDEVQSHVEDLKTLNILIEVNGRLLSLATRDDL